MTIPFERNVPLAPFTTLGIGGPARLFTRVTSVEQLRDALAFDGPIFILGGGSNLLIADEGFDGLVIRIELRGIEFQGEVAKVAAGEPWDDFVAMAVERGLAGIECLSGIPGLTGATPIQNVGAYGQDVSETIDRVEAFDRKSGAIVEFTNEECRFGYRSSHFKNVEKERYVILSVTFRLNAGGPASVRYPELRQYLGDKLESLSYVREAVIAIRKRKGMVLDPNDPDTRSDGSFFMNPIVTAEQYAELAKLAPDAPHFAADRGQVKLSAAWLIEHAGFHKGFVHGNVGLSTKHTLAIVNRCGTASEVLELVRMIQDGVRAAFAVAIHPEPNFIGFATLDEVLPHSHGSS